MRNHFLTVFEGTVRGCLCQELFSMLLVFKLLLSFFATVGFAEEIAVFVATGLLLAFLFSFSSSLVA